MNGATVEALIVGAGPAGLAVGACLRREGVPFTILERDAEVGSSWRRHYDRLHLHTDKARSALPYLPFPRDWPRYPSRDQVVEYLESYARHFELAPRFGQEVTRVERADGAWVVRTTTTEHRSRCVIVATGYNRRPRRPDWPGFEDFPGPVLHSREYQNGRALASRDVLVVGFGNSGAEITLDLWEHGARPAVVVRGPVNVIPRDLLGLPILSIAIPLSRLPPRLADALSRPAVRMALGDLGEIGLRRPGRGPFTDIAARDRIPVIDVGTIDLIRRGAARVRPGVERFEGDEVIFVDGTRERYDAVILATGNQPALDDFLVGAGAALDERGVPRASGVATPVPGLYFCGFYVSPTGMLRDIALEARRIARRIAAG